jgi:hypothetical protein
MLQLQLYKIHWSTLEYVYTRQQRKQVGYVSLCKWSLYRNNTYKINKNLLSLPQFVLLFYTEALTILVLNADILFENLCPFTTIPL